MAKFAIKRNSTSQIVRVFIQDTSKSDGSGLAGLTAASSGLVSYYTRTGDSTGATAITLTGTGTLGTYTSGFFKEVDSSNVPGEYELHIPNAVFQATGNTARVYLRGAANMLVTAIEFEVDAIDFQSATVTVGTNNDKTGYTVSTNNDKTGYTVSTVTDKTGYTVSTVTDKTGYFLDASATVTVGTNNDKTGYTASTVTDKTGYTVSTNNDKTGYTVSTVSDKTGYFLDASATVTVGTNNDKTGYTASTVSDKTGYTVSTVSDKTGYSLASSERDAIANNLFDIANGIETGETFRQTMRLIRAVLAGISTDSNGTYVLKRKNGTTTAITILHDANGNRSSSTVGTL